MHCGYKINANTMKRIYKTKDLKGIKKTGAVENLINLINENDCSKLNTYTLRFSKGEEEEAYYDITYYALKNGMFQRSRYCDGNPYDLARISSFLVDLFNASYFDVERFLRSMAHFSRYKNQVAFYDRFGLNTFEY